LRRAWLKSNKNERGGEESREEHGGVGGGGAVRSKIHSE